MLDLLIALTLVILVIILFLMLRFSGKIEKVSIDQETIKGALATCWKELGLDQDIGAIKQRADDIQKATQNLENLFKVTRGRAAYGEFQQNKL